MPNARGNHGHGSIREIGVQGRVSDQLLRRSSCDFPTSRKGCESANGGAATHERRPSHRFWNSPVPHTSIGRPQIEMDLYVYCAAECPGGHDEPEILRSSSR
jgi:hypothetical protein